jgi:hypothetical protein
LQSLIEEALGDLLEKRRQSRPRDHVMSAYQRSHEALCLASIKSSPNDRRSHCG